MTPLVRLFASVLAGGVLAVAAGSSAAHDDVVRTAGPYVPTPQVIVDRMLQLANVTGSDFVIDLGSGDGRIVRTAAKAAGARGFGVDIDAELVDRSNTLARRDGIAERAKFYRQDVFAADLSQASVVTLYVLPEMMRGLRQKLLAELRPGSRIVSHDYHFDEWPPDDRVSFEVPEKADAVGFSSTTLYRWIVPANVGGHWRLQVDGTTLPEVTLELEQMFQRVNGAKLAGSRRADIGNARVTGRTFEFSADFGVDTMRDRYTYSGTVKDGTIEGEVVLGVGPKATRHRWKAVRLSEPMPIAR